MRAFQLHTYDGPGHLQLVDVPAPAVGDGDVLLDVRAVGINFPDLLMTKGQYQDKPELPFVPGCELAGVVREAPSGSRWRPGDRVAAFVTGGAYAEQAAVPAASLVAVPEGADLGTGAALVVNYHTAHFALTRRGHMRSGETVLVLGAAGGIGTAAVQVAKGLGGHVIAGVADDDQRDVALAAGADSALVLTEGFSRGLLDSSGGVDVVVDPVGGWLFTEALRALRPEGRILVIGFAAGEIPTVRVNRLLLKNVAAVGVAWGAFLEVDPGIVEQAGAELQAMHEAGVVRPQISERFRFEEIPQALQKLERGAIAGKAVAEIPPA